MDAVTRVAGCDLGKAAAKLVIAALDPSGQLRVERFEVVEHGGDPLGAFCRWYEREDVSRCAALGATGLAADALVAPATASLPESACVEAALPLLAPSGPLNVLGVGARGYAVLARDSEGRVTHLENDKCSAGTGETMVKIAGRFGLSIVEADRLALLREHEAIPITARCSVFAKSEMTHYGNQGRPAGALFRGYFESVAGTVAALLARVRVAGPALVIGGCSRLGALVAAIGERLGQQAIVPAHALCFEAVGAVALAAEQWLAAPGGSAPLPVDARALVRPSTRRFVVRMPARHASARVTRLSAAPVAPGSTEDPCVLGLDLGSTGSKAVLTRLRDGEAVLDRYDRTRGNPVDAAQRLVRAVLAACSPDVRAIALTGSGREAAASVLRAVYPDLADRIVVENEIVAHATAAIRCDRDGGRSLSVVEIGGQDAKFIQIRGGQIVESDMNKACSAGTGSFLEEQATFYGVDDIETFTELAQRAERPPDLGQMCTVFVAEAAAEAHGDGFELADIFGGFQYSVIHNYLSRVMGQRTFGDTVFFQGKPASGPSLAWTLAAVAERDVVVPPNPGAAGAWGIGLCALEALGAERLAGAEAPRFALERTIAAEVVERREIACRDKRCATYCAIEQTTVAVGEKRTRVRSGGACPKYEIADRAVARKLPREAPSAFDEREALIEGFVNARRQPGDDAAAQRRGRRVGLPAVGACVGVLPWLTTFLEALGLEPVMLRPDRSALGRGEALCFAYDACSPAKIAHAVVASARGVVDRVFFPKLLAVGDADSPGGRTCPVEQALPEVVREALAACGQPVDVISPPLSLDAQPSIVRIAQLGAALGRLGAPAEKLPAALASADLAQRRYERELAAIGQRTLRYGRERGVPVVLVCGALHVLHDSVVNAGVPRLLRENGALALPMDCLSIDGDIDALAAVPWADASRALRAALWAREHGGVYPLMLSSFGCGPASFVEQLFAAVMAGYPHTALESDGHGGSAGYVTRVQAFMHAVRRHDGAPSAPSAEQLALLQRPERTPMSADRDARVLVLSIGDFAPVMAATLRAEGFAAVPSGPNTPEVLGFGRGDCSGKECLPYQLIWGAFRQQLEREPPGPGERAVLLQVEGSGMCRNCMFPLKDRLSLRHMGIEDRVGLRVMSQQDLGFAYLARLWAGVVGWDLLNQLRLYYLPLAPALDGAVERLYRRFYDELVDRIALSGSGRGGSGVAAALARLLSPGLGVAHEAAALGAGWRALGELLDRASGAFAALAASPPERANGGSARVVAPGGGATAPTALLAGDIYLRLDAFASDDVARRLAARGVRILLDPLSTLAEYMAAERMNELLGLPTALLPNALARLLMGKMRRALYGRVAKRHPWLRTSEVAEHAAHARPVLDRYPQGEAPATIGAVLHHARTGQCDGAVVVSPWGCGPGLVSEAQLRHQRDLPMLFVYGDGSPIDERRLAAFAFRLHRQRARGGGGGSRPSAKASARASR